MESSRSHQKGSRLLRRRPSAVMLVATTLLLCSCGCLSAKQPASRDTNNVVFVVHGVDGSGLWYSGLMEGLGETGRDVQMVQWGGPLLILPNLQLKAVHDAAQETFAKRLREWQHDHPAGKVTVVAHSAGCGVVLETLTASKADVSVETIVLLAPALSAKYDLAPAMAHVRGRVHVFYSDNDDLLLKIGTSVAGTYDSVWGESAGLRGFTAADKLPEALKARLIQHPYDPSWKDLGNGGGHMGWRSKPFVEKVLVPLATAEPVAEPK